MASQLATERMKQQYGNRKIDEKDPVEGFLEVQMEASLVGDDKGESDVRTESARPRTAFAFL